MCDELGANEEKNLNLGRYFQGQESKDKNLLVCSSLFSLCFKFYVCSIDRLLFLVSIFLHICYIFPILVSIFEMLVLNA